ncbi:MAG TPA: hypothetical protein ENI23_02715 [bacterium]|nr:hypothetical protein [bacterium]
MANPHPKGNPNIVELGKQPSPAKTEVGKFFRDLPKFSREKVPHELIELYDFVQGLDTKKVNYLLEMTNLYKVLQKAMIPTLIDKLTKGEAPDRKELDALRLLKDIMSESHKLKYGDRKVIENVVSVVDIRKHMMKDKIVKVAEVISDDS